MYRNTIIPINGGHAFVSKEHRREYQFIRGASMNQFMNQLMRCRNQIEIFVRFTISSICMYITLFTNEHTHLRSQKTREHR